MLMNHSLRCASGLARPRERGVVLILALIVLAAMTLAGIGLTRSVLTSNKIAGNLAFLQSATNAADIGIETAIAWLENRNANAPTALHGDLMPGGVNLGYFSNVQLENDPAPGGSWEQAWAVYEGTGRVNEIPLTRDQLGGNRVRYVIHRLCRQTGAPEAGIGCSASPVVVGSDGGSRGSGVVALAQPTQRYYRITVRVDGPRNAVSFVQSIVAM